MDIIVSYGCFILTDWQIFSSIGQDKTTLTFLRAGFRVFDPTSVTTGLVRDLIHFIYLTFAPAWYALPINKSGDDHRPYYSPLIINGKCNIARNTSKNNLSLLSQFSLSRSYELWLLYLRKTTFHCFKKILQLYKVCSRLGVNSETVCEPNSYQNACMQTEKRRFPNNTPLDRLKILRTINWVISVRRNRIVAK